MMNTNPAHANGQQQNATTKDNRRDDDQFWSNWWREYAENWK